MSPSAASYVKMKSCGSPMGTKSAAGGSIAGTGKSRAFQKAAGSSADRRIPATNRDVDGSHRRETVGFRNWRKKHAEKKCSLKVAINKRDEGKNS